MCLLKEQFAALAPPPPAKPSEAVRDHYRCADCGCLRTREQGAEIFTVCDECWAKHYQPAPGAERRPDLEQTCPRCH